MDLTEYVRILRQRWLLVVLPCLGALLVAGFTLPGGQQTRPVATSYQATATLITSPPLDNRAAPALNLPTVALYATTGEIPELAAKRLKFTDEPQLLAAQLTVTPQPETGTLTFTSSDGDAVALVKRVNAFAEATVQYFGDQQLMQDRARIDELELQLRDLTTRIERLDNPGAGVNGAVIEAQTAALQTQYQTIFGELNLLQQRVGTADQLDVLQPAVAIPLGTATFAPPNNPWVRLGTAALLGIVLGAALALVVERLDSRMRSREQVEDVTGLPVLAEIPRLPRHRRDEIVSATRPASAAAEVYRSLRSSILLLAPSVASDRSGGGGALTVLVTSSLPGEGKTTTVANLAAVMAEAGRRVLVLSLDLRSPRLHQHFGVVNITGASELLAADRGRHLEQVVRPTDLPGVGLVTSGEPTDHPGALLASVGPMITAARSLADIVLIDTPPMLVVADALDVARHTDVTLLVTRLNKTTRSQAAECQRSLSRLGISALGTVLVGSRPAGARYGYPLMGDQHGPVSVRKGTDASAPGGATPI